MWKSLARASRSAVRPARLADVWERVRGFVQRWEWAADAAVAVIVLLMLLQPLLGDGDSDCDCGPIAWWGYALVVVQALPLVWRRRWPLAVVLVSGGAAAVYGMAELPDPPVPFAALVAVYSVAAHDTRRRANLAGGIGIVLVSLVLVTDPGADLADVTVNYLVFVTAWLLGDGTRRRRELASELEERTAYLERTRAAEAAAAAAEERNRIAREMHDVVAHHLSLMVVQAEAGPVVVRSDPKGAEEAFDAISATGKEALTQMRRLLGVLRPGEVARDEAAAEADGPGRADAAAPDVPLAPQPAATEIPDLVSRLRAAGLAVDLVVEGAVEALPPAVDLTAYRIVQEALTNAMRHGRPTQIRVMVRCGVEAVDLVVENDGLGAEASLLSGPSAAGGQPGSRGQGLVAMRERASLVGGWVTAGPADGGWRVHARLPVSEETAR